MRIRFSEKSAASAPPAWALIEISASRASYSPFSSVRTSSWAISARSPARSLRTPVLVFLGQAEHDQSVVQPLAQAGQPVQLGLQVGQPALDLPRPLLVGPQPG